MIFWAIPSGKLPLPSAILWLVVWNIWLIFHPVGKFIIPIDEDILQRGFAKNHQAVAGWGNHPLSSGIQWLGKHTYLDRYSIIQIYPDLQWLGGDSPDLPAISGAMSDEEDLATKEDRIAWLRARGVRIEEPGTTGGYAGGKTCAGRGQKWWCP